MTEAPHTLDRRRLLTGSAAIAAGMAAAAVAEPAAASQSTSALHSTVDSVGGLASATVQSTAQYAQYDGPAFVDAYTTNVIENQTAETNAAVRILSGFEALWQTGPDWDNGTVVDDDVLEANMAYSAEITGNRPDAVAKQSFIFDRQHQSYSAIGGLGPLEAAYKAGAKAVTAITSAPDGIPDGKISDSVPAGAPAGSATGAGAADSELGRVAQLVNTVRGPFASSNPSKFAYQYPRPYRMNEDSEVAESGGIPVLGVPAYDSDVVVAPQLLRQRSTNPAEDGGFPSGHTNAAWMAAIALAYAVPERFQEQLARAADVAHSRITAGMHSAVDVIGGRILGTALAAAALHDPANADLKAEARAQALAYFTAAAGVSADELHAYAHREGPDTDQYADREVNRARYRERLTYFLKRSGSDAPLTVPKGAEVLLETRLPYLDAEQRREVLRTTALKAGYPILDGPEQWGRLDLFAAADGYGRFDDDVHVVMDAAQGGFSAADTWRGDIGGPGKLTKSGAGALTLAGDNAFSGGVALQDGTLGAASPNALGKGGVTVTGGTLAVDTAQLELRAYAQSNATLRVRLGDGDDPALDVSKEVALGPAAVLRIALDPQRPPAAGMPLTVIKAKQVTGTFAEVVLDLPGHTVTVEYEKKRVKVRIDAA
ncbi:phosphatase PAP2 family protein [Glycomyces sp. TRM65418]|uniref:phosphatase PAP2 family protein n=1 Tax=Glycomyces sp. TRM65418 TaxID=2867006 RepID=UPI001CE69B0C|nr:phosphatase PAP2 family protein [Glycomyces sp. TRM65418]MCC3765255.1 phosphatase PAP2 family protein [Glycomyces sp. TRM65418]QZD54876.1 phosphatase PAP2 family protein [Glycomyces sp. TRM65418]